VAPLSGISAVSTSALTSPPFIIHFSDMLQILKKVVKKALLVPTNLSHQVALLRHANQRPDLTFQDQKIVEACQKEGVCVTSLAAIDITSTPRLLKAAESQLALMEKAAGHGQLGSASQPALPQIFMVADLPEFAEWACDRRLLNLVYPLNSKAFTSGATLPTKSPSPPSYGIGTMKTAALSKSLCI
jgi:hypothetical protein